MAFLYADLIQNQDINIVFTMHLPLFVLPWFIGALIELTEVKNWESIGSIPIDDLASGCALVIDGAIDSITEE